MEKRLDEISIIPIVKKGITRKSEPFKPGRRRERSSIRKERTG
jgi:hypothetical protein